jgi:hypothetical protein
VDAVATASAAIGDLRSRIAGPAGLELRGRFTPISWAMSGEPLQGVADPVAAALESALALHRAGADPKALRRALRRIGELLDE